MTETRRIDADGRGVAVTSDELSHPRQGEGAIRLSASIVGLPDGAKLTLDSSGWPDSLARYAVDADADADAAARVDAAWRAVVRGD